MNDYALSMRPDSWNLPNEHVVEQQLELLLQPLHIRYEINPTHYDCLIFAVDDARLLLMELGGGFVHYYCEDPDDSLEN